MLERYHLLTEDEHKILKKLRRSINNKVSKANVLK